MSRDKDSKLLEVVIEPLDVAIEPHSTASDGWSESQLLFVQW